MTFLLICQLHAAPACMDTACQWETPQTLALHTHTTRHTPINHTPAILSIPHTLTGLNTGPAHSHNTTHTHTPHTSNTFYSSHTDWLKHWPSTLTQHHTHPYTTHQQCFLFLTHWLAQTLALHTHTTPHTPIHHTPAILSIPHTLTGLNTGPAHSHNTTHHTYTTHQQYFLFLTHWLAQTLALHTHTTPHTTHTPHTSFY